MGSEGDVQQEIQPGSWQTSILVPGRNCRQVVTARRAALLIDSESYFTEVEKALRSATRSIFIIGWDFDPRIQLRPQDGPSAPILGDLLRTLVEQKPQLEIRVLVWSLAPIHAPGAATELLVGKEWQEHPRIHLQLDTQHPIQAAHHQKIVSIDDSLTFVGGIDLTVERWDTSRHAPDEPNRVYPDGTPYEPVHDMQMMVAGPAARLAAAVAHERWHEFTGETIPLCGPVERWPADLSPVFENVPMGVSRTIPAFGARPPVEEAAALTEDLMRAAKRSIYIEAQYFTARCLRPILRELLSRSYPPEIVVIVPLNANGIVERFIMGANRDRLLRSLEKADHAKRLRLYYPMVGPGRSQVLVHSKLIIVDDQILRVGSSNLNNRSVGLDTECDLAVEADRPETHQAIAGYRDRLLAEHLGVEPATLSAEISRQGSLIGAIDKLNGNERCLRPVEVQPGSPRSFPGTGLLDPERPFPLVESLRAWWHGRSRQDPSEEPAGSESDSSISEETNRMLPSRSGKRK